MQDLLANCLITWRITSLLLNEHGPYEVFDKVRDAVGIDYDEFGRKLFSNELARMFGCFWCCSIWVALCLAVIRRKSILEAFAYSAGAIYLNYAVGEYIG